MECHTPATRRSSLDGPTGKSKPPTVYDAVIGAVGSRWIIAREIQADVGSTEGSVNRALHRAMRAGLIERRERDEYTAACELRSMSCAWPVRYEYRSLV